jgi:hypothetical protein
MVDMFGTGVKPLRERWTIEKEKCNGRSWKQMVLRPVHSVAKGVLKEFRKEQGSIQTINAPINRTKTEGTRSRERQQG